VTEGRRALAWAVLMLAALGIVVWRTPTVPVETSVFALAPQDEGERGVAEATKALREDAQKRLVFLVGHTDPAQAGAAADALAAALQGIPSLSEVHARVPEAAAGALLRFYAPHQALLLQPEDQARLDAGPAALTDAALRNLYLPPGLSGSLGFEQDSFGQAGRWLAARAGAAGKLHLRDGRLWAEGEGRQWVLVSAELKVRPTGLSQAGTLEGRLNAARDQALAQPGIQVIRSGFSFHELAAARHWLDVAVSEHRLIADVCQGYDVVVMGADKWAQVLDPSFHESEDHWRASMARLPRVAVARRGDLPIEGDVLVLDVDLGAVSSTAVREGRHDWRAH